MSATAARPKGPLVLAIGLGAITSFGVVSYLQRQQEIRTREELLPLVVAARQVEAETRLQAADVTIQQVPRRLYPKDGLNRPEAAAGRITRTGLFPGDPLMAAKLYPPDSEGGLTLSLPPGMRAVTVAVDEVTGVAGFLKPGHKVDLIGTRDGRHGQSRAQIVVQNIPVLAVAQDRKDRHHKEARLVSSVTLMASPAQAEQITLASEQGKIRLALRAKGDDAVVKTPGAGWQIAAPPARSAPAPMAARPAPPVPARPAAAPPPPAATIEIYRGARRDEVAERR